VVQPPRAKAGSVSSAKCGAMPIDCEALAALIWASWKTLWVFNLCAVTATLDCTDESLNDIK
jgi:hypothetical protein